MSREERVIAYGDGELAGAEVEAFEAELARDARLAAEVAQQKRLKARLAQAYRPVLEEEVPAGLVASASAANDRGRPGWLQWGALAASLVAGVVIGRLTLPQESGALRSTGDALVAQAGLARALDTKLASDPGPVRVGLTFRTAGGGYCRTFQSDPDRLAGVACREDGRWVVQTTTAWSPASGPDYRMAGSDTPAPVLSAVDQLIAGEALDASSERAARDRGWTSR
jgi:hypothetical protein